MRRLLFVVLLLAGGVPVVGQTVKNGVSAVGLKTAAGADLGTAASPLFVTPFFGTLFPPSVITSAMTGTTSTQLVAAVGGSFLYVTSCQFSNDHATQDTTMLLQDGSGGTTIWKGNVPHGGGSNVLFPSPLKVPTRGNALYTVNVTTGSSTYAACQGFSSTTSY